MRLETARLVIRSFEAHDVDPWIALVNDSEVGRFTPPSPPATLETFHGALARLETMERERGDAMYPAEGKGPDVELAYHYAPVTWGHGYATEAAIAMLTCAIGSAGLDQVIALVMPENVGSWRRRRACAWTGSRPITIFRAYANTSPTAQGGARRSRSRARGARHGLSNPAVWRNPRMRITEEVIR